MKNADTGKWSGRQMFQYHLAKAWAEADSVRTRSENGDVEQFRKKLLKGTKYVNIGQRE